MGSKKIAELIRKNIESATPRFNGKSISLTASIEVSVQQADITNNNSLLHEADKAMYAAKKTGRNRVIVYIA